MKVIFLDVDGVLNNTTSLYNDKSLEDDLIRNLASIVKVTDAKIILTSTWRFDPDSLSILSDALKRFDLSIAEYTQHGVDIRDFKYTRFKDVTPIRNSFTFDTYVYDRGAEIAIWLLQHDDVEKFVILDDDDFDIQNWFSAELVKTNFFTGLTKEDAIAAIKLLN